MCTADSSPLRRAELSNGLLTETISSLLVLTEASPEVLDKVKRILYDLNEFIKACGQDPRALTIEPLVFPRGPDVRDWVLEDASSALEVLGCFSIDPLLVDESRCIITFSEFKRIVSELDSEI